MWHCKNTNIPVCKHLLQLYLQNTNCIQGCANYCRRNAHMGALHRGSTVCFLHIPVLMCTEVFSLPDRCVCTESFVKLLSRSHTNNSQEVEALSCGGSFLTFMDNLAMKLLYSSGPLGESELLLLLQKAGTQGMSE